MRSSSQREPAAGSTPLEPRFALLRVPGHPMTGPRKPISEPERAGHLMASVLSGVAKVATVVTVAASLLVLTPELVRVALYAGGVL